MLFVKIIGIVICVFQIGSAVLDMLLDSGAHIHTVQTADLIVIGVIGVISLPLDIGEGKGPSRRLSGMDGT